MIIKGNTYFTPPFSFLKGKKITEMEHYILFNNFIPGDYEVEISDEEYNKKVNKLEKKGYLKDGLPTTEYFKSPSDFSSIKETLETFSISASVSEIETLLSILTPAKERKKRNKKETTYNLTEGNWNGELRKFLYELFENSSKGVGVIFDVGEEINSHFMEEKILKPITNNWIRIGIIPMEGGKPVFDNGLINQIINKLQLMFDWHEERGKPIKNMKSTINTFFGKK